MSTSDHRGGARCVDSQGVARNRRDPDVPDPQEFDAYKALEPSQKALINQLVTSLTRLRKAARRRLYASQILRMAALTMATGVPISIAASAPNWVAALLGGGAALLEGSIQVFRYEERAPADIRRNGYEPGELEAFLAVRAITVMRPSLSNS